MGKMKSTEATTVMLDLDNTMSCMQITKNKDTVLVVQSHEIIVVVDKYMTISGEPFVKLAKVYNTPQQAYEEWLKVIGKMCKKECTSKYFGKPLLGGHLVNGKYPKCMKPIIIDIAKTAVQASKNV